MPRSGFAGAVTCSPSACSRFITSFQLEPSAKAPCTRTTVGCDPSCGLMLIASPFPTRFSSGGSTFPLDAWCHHPQSGANFGEGPKGEVRRIRLPCTPVNKYQGCIGPCYVASFLMGKGTRVNGG